MCVKHSEIITEKAHTKICGKKRRNLCNDPSYIGEHCKGKHCEESYKKATGNILLCKIAIVLIPMLIVFGSSLF